MVACARHGPNETLKAAKSTQVSELDVSREKHREHRIVWCDISPRTRLAHLKT